MVWKLPVSGPWRTAADYSQIIVGSMLVGIGVNLFFVPNQVVSGGVTGIAILMHYAYNTPVGLVTLILNLPLLAIGWKWAGSSCASPRPIPAPSWPSPRPRRSSVRVSPQLMPSPTELLHPSA